MPAAPDFHLLATSVSSLDTRTPPLTRVPAVLQPGNRTDAHTPCPPPRPCHLLPPARSRPESSRPGAGAGGPRGGGPHPRGGLRALPGDAHRQHAHRPLRPPAHQRADRSRGRRLGDPPAPRLGHSHRPLRTLGPLRPRLDQRAHQCARGGARHVSRPCDAIGLDSRHHRTRHRRGGDDPGRQRRGPGPVPWPAARQDRDVHANARGEPLLGAAGPPVHRGGAAPDG